MQRGNKFRDPGQRHETEFTGSFAGGGRIGKRVGRCARGPDVDFQRQFLSPWLLMVLILMVY